MVDTGTYEVLLSEAERGVREYLDEQLQAGRIARNYYEQALANVIPNLRAWLLDPHIDRISPNLKRGVAEAIRQKRWDRIVNAYAREVKFGTGGIREKMGFDRDEVLRIKEEGIGAPVLKGPNTINDIVLLLKSVGVARYARQHGLERIIIGFDSRVRGGDFARLIARLFLANDCTVCLFDEACTYPHVTYALPTLRGDVGIFISASHNDFRYNGYKLSCGNGSQFDPQQRNDIYENYIRPARPADIRLIDLAEAPPGRLWFLGGEPTSEQFRDGPFAGCPRGAPLPGVDYAGAADRIVDLHTMHIEHCKQFVLRRDMIASMSEPLRIAYSAFNGSGRKAVPRLLSEIGFSHVERIARLDPLDGMFPAFRSDPGFEQQPDPGDPRAADIAVRCYIEEKGSQAWDRIDVLIGTDPDADRCGVVVKVPPAQREIYGGKDYYLLPADDAWTLLLWYRLNWELEQFGQIRDAHRKFIALSHTTTEALVSLARRHGLGVVRTWVGFAQLAAAVRMVWESATGRGAPLPEPTEGRLAAGDARCHPTLHSIIDMNTGQRDTNIGAFEQSNGFSILGGPPPDEFSLGRGGHVRDKDGTLAALLMAEVAAWAKTHGMSLIELLDEKIYLDPAIGLFVTYYEPDPLDGEYPGLAGDTHKRNLLVACERFAADFRDMGLHFAGRKVTGSVIYRTGKYDAVNWEGFPDEGVRFYFDGDTRNMLTIRPSGTSNALRFHVQLYGGVPSREELVPRKGELMRTARAIVDELRERIGAPRNA